MLNYLGTNVKLQIVRSANLEFKAMASPFPGMDPYLEHPNFWPEVHSRLIVAIADALVPQVRPKYKVAIEKRIYQITSNNDDNSLLVGIPDAAVTHQSNLSKINDSDVAVTSVKTKPVKVFVPMLEEIKQAYLEVKDLATGKVITAIEVLSPVNKRSGEGREAYLKKRQQILGSLTNFVEIDLLRGWQAMPILNNDINVDYRVLVSRTQQRPRADLYAFNLPEELPTFSLPLCSEDIEP
ncbi:MAG: DUF4058 family protein [Spirulinaceae cyanobacterium]